MIVRFFELSSKANMFDWLHDFFSNLKIENTENFLIKWLGNKYDIVIGTILFFLASFGMAWRRQNCLVYERLRMQENLRLDELQSTEFTENELILESEKLASTSKPISVDDPKQIPTETKIENKEDKLLDKKIEDKNSNIDQNIKTENEDNSKSSAANTKSD